MACVLVRNPEASEGKPLAGFRSARSRDWVCKILAFGKIVGLGVHFSEKISAFGEIVGLSVHPSKYIYKSAFSKKAGLGVQTICVRPFL